MVTDNINDPSNLSIDEIIDRAIAGDLDAFGCLYEKNVDRIYNYIYYRTGNHTDAEDLTSKVFIRAINHINRYRKTEVPFSAWLYRIAHNLVANWYRDRKRRQDITLDENVEIRDKSEHLESGLVNDEYRLSLLQLLNQLPPERQQLLILKYVEQLPNDEIGKIMGRSEGAIKSLYHRTLLTLRDKLELLE
jgi:RNA polymerase sigma-70 factor (ECF subfamily)